MANQVAATGTLLISLDDAGMQATARFTPGDGETWTPDRLIDEMRRSGIVEGFKPDDLRRSFALVLANGRTEPLVIARGIEPSEPQPERVRFLEITIPTELREQADAVLSDAPPPVIEIEKTERVRREQAVAARPRLPFLRERRRTRVLTEAVVRRERVYVDPAVQKTGYAAAGQRIAILKSAVDGDTGRSVTGDPIPARVLADPYFYCGAGIDRRHGELSARYDGFVRAGANWVDVLPFETHDWKVTLSPDMATPLLSFAPGHARAKPPRPEEVVEAAAALGCPTERIELGLLREMISRSTASGAPLREEPLTASRDAFFEVYVSEDRQEALLTLHKGAGRGKPLDLKAVGSAIKESGLAGLDYERIKRDVSVFYRSPETDLVGYALAEGSLPATGPLRTLDFGVRFLRDQEADATIGHLRQALPGLIDDPASGAAFPPDAIDGVAPVDHEQRVVAISPVVPGRPGTDVYGRQIPGKDAAVPPLELYGNLERKGNVVIATAAGLLHRGHRDGTVLLRAMPHRDASVGVRVTENRMAALVTLTPAVGTGRPVAWDTVQEAFRSKGISSGIREPVLLRAWECVCAGRTIRDLIVARGRHPGTPGASAVEFLVEMAMGRTTIRPDGRADYRNQDGMATVGKGQRIARVPAASLAREEGWDVLGAKLAPRSEEAGRFQAGPNVVVTDEPDGSQVFTAAIDGELVVEQNRIDVRSAYSVAGDVDLHTGNVRFPGSVTVTGSVRSGFYVMSGGSIHVGKLVEAALLSAEGDIVVNQGVKGGGKAVLRTKGAVGMAFAEQATILSVGNVQARNSLVHCHVKTNARVRMIGASSRIVGGRVRARDGLETHHLGSDRGVRTVVEFGQDFLVADRIEREEREIEKLKREVTRVDLAIKEAELRGGGRRLDALHVQKLHAQKLQMLKLLERRGLRVFTYRERFEQHYPSDITVTGTLHPGVVFETHGRTLEITSPRRNVVIAFDPATGRIEERGATPATRGGP